MPDDYIEYLYKKSTLSSKVNKPIKKARVEKFNSFEYNDEIKNDSCLSDDYEEAGYDC